MSTKPNAISASKIKVNLADAFKIMTNFVKADVPVNLMGAPGLGKSDVVKQVAESLNLKVIDFRLSTADPTDLSGLPFVNGDRSAFLPNEAFPIRGDSIPVRTDAEGNIIYELDKEGKPTDKPSYYSGWLLFLDEITNAPMSVQAAAYKIILDREVGNHKLHSAVKIISAGNNMDDGAAVVAEISTALKSRMAHLNVEFSVGAWLDWAVANGVHHSVTSFIKFKPEELYRFDAQADSDTFPCPRTWFMASNVVHTMGINHDLLSDMLGATITRGSSIEYLNFCKNFVNLPTYADVVANPEGIDIPTESSVLYALSGSIAAQTVKGSVVNVIKFINRLPEEFQLRTFNDIVKRNASLVTVPEVRQWVQKNAKELLAD